MNILLNITPKNQIAYVYDDYTLRQTLEKLEHHGYSAVPIIDRDGRYIATITEGDLLHVIKNRFSLNIKEAEGLPLMEIPRRFQIEAVTVHTSMDDLIAHALNQNFVPVVDDRGVFIGIITRKKIIQYLSAKCQKFTENSVMEIEKTS